jgi:predicted ABC-type ATPase
MPARSPKVILLAGPNGAGKSTAAPALLRGLLGVTEFVNADTIARGLSQFAPESVAFHAGRIMLTRLSELAEARADFAFETTLATRSFAPRLRLMAHDGYEIYLAFLSLPNADAAVARVQERVRAGGHSVPDQVIRRRFDRGLNNFFRVYRPLATGWRFYDNSALEPRLVATGRGSTERVFDAALWRQIVGTAYGNP